ncbi:helix-turn-helix domain-containing protein [Kitasatospora purpeofusca]|uniref:helix-turn-helix domain-containing protein n=1 Tax=Kitasatospora purpeofusca TaxID=67352 RepID=UPI002E15BAEE|nr:helix-turn-helix domain-containing protein [Kitasatospora purpeofusca]
MSVETEKFAELLRALKDRSGRSYGVLAARLHVSTSTLHRYCNGAAVPTEYAPVERLARVCGASADELVELHRRWILADASRRRESAAPAAPTPRPAAEPTPAPDTTTAEPDETPGGQPTREPHRRRRTTRILLSAAAVAVVAALVPVVVLSGRSGTPAAGPGPSASAAATASAPASAAPDPAGQPGPPGPPADPTTTPTPTPTPTSAPTAADEEAPFHVNVLTDNWGSPCGQWLVSAQPPGTTPAPPAGRRTDSWAAAQHAVPGGHLRLQLTAQGSEDKPVVLHALYVQVASTRPAPKWNAYTMGSGCGGSLTPAAFAVDLDAAAPRSVPVPAMEGNRKGRTSDFPFRVSSTDPQVLNVDASTAGQDVSWYLEVVWSSGDRQGTLLVNDHGKPFRTVGLRGAPGYFWADDTRGWTRTPTDA